jgi:hypothetical protein
LSVDVPEMCANDADAEVYALAVESWRGSPNACRDADAIAQTVASDGAGKRFGKVIAVTRVAGENPHSIAPRAR